MAPRALTSWLLCLLIGLGGLTPRALAGPCCADEAAPSSVAATDHDDCCHGCSPATTDEPDRDEPCPGNGVCPKACCAAPAPIFVSSTLTLGVPTAEPAGVTTLTAQTGASPAHALSLLRPPRS